MRTLALSLLAIPSAIAGVTMAPLATFSGNGDGWLAPGEGGQTHLGDTDRLQRGLAYNPQTDHLLLLSRFGGAVSIRILDSQTAAELGTLPAPEAGFTGGGFFAANMIGVGEDGAIYAASLQLNVGTGAWKVYRWQNETATPTVYFEGLFNGSSPELPSLAGVRCGDSLDVTGSGLATRVVAGFQSTAGYLVLTQQEGPLAGDPPVGVPAVVNTFTPTGPTSGDFRLGITFGKDGPSHVWGRQSGTGPVRRTTFSGTAGAYSGATTVPVANVIMDYAQIGGVPLLAIMNVNSAATGLPSVDLLDVTDPAAPALARSLSTVPAATLVPGTQTPNNRNVDGTGSVKWGKTTVSGTTTSSTLYAMATNQGIQAFTVTITPDITPAAIAADPVAAAVFDRGIATFRVSATGTPPLTYQWLKDGQPVTGATTSTLTISPVGAADVATYSCIVNNAAAAPATSAGAALTVLPSVNTGALTQCWQLAPGSRAYLTEGDAQRGLAFDVLKNQLYLATRSPAASIQVLNATTGAHLHELDTSTISGGTFVLSHVGVGSDGRIYAANLADGGTFKIYRWMDDTPGVPPEEIFASSLTGRIGDTFAVRGSGNNTEIIAGTRTGDSFVLFKFDVNGSLLSYPLTVAGAANGAFGLGIAFGQGNTVWGKNSGSGLTLATFTMVPPVEPETPPTYTAALTATLGTGAIPSSGGAIAVDPVNGCLAHIHVADSDNVRLYRLPQPFPDPAPATLSLLDQEFFSTDNANANGTGQLVFGGDKLIALNTNNGLACYTVAKPTFVQPEITDVIYSGTDVTFTLKGAAGRTYVIERSTQLTPANTWTADGTVTLATDTQSVTRAVDPGETKLYWRAREQ